jgi:hypothetical protein
MGFNLAFEGLIPEKRQILERRKMRKRIGGSHWRVEY